MIKLRVIVVVFIVSLLFSSISVSAEKFEFDNNGNTKLNPYGKNTSIPPSYEGLEYYDCYVPYAKKVKEIGGLCTSGLTDKQNGKEHSSMPEANQNYFVGDHVNYEYPYLDLSYSSGGFLPKGKYIGAYETDTNATIWEDANGNKYYGFAIQRFFYPEDKKYFPWSIENRGQLVDVILTNGTVIHFVVADANSHEDCNGYDGDTSSGTDRVCNTLNFPQYQYLFSSVAGNCIELWARSPDDCSVFGKKYGLRTDGTGAHIAYYRMYKGTIMENPTRTSKAGKEAAYSLNGEVIVTDTQPDQGRVTENSGGTSEGENGKVSLGDDAVLKDEFELEGMKDFKSKISDKAEKIDLVDINTLNTDEIENMSYIKNNISSSSKEKIMTTIRVSIVALGILMLLYIILLIIAISFDNANTFFDFSLLGVFTLGRLNLVDDEKNGRGFTMKKLIRVCVVLFVVSAMLISGVTIFNLVQNLYYILNGILDFIRKSLLWRSK